MERRPARAMAALLLAWTVTMPTVLADTPQAAAAPPPGVPPRPGAGGHRLPGVPVTGGPHSTGATAIRPGTYTDSLGAGETRWYAVTLDAAATADLSATAVPRPGARVDYGDGIDMRLAAAGPAGWTCDTRSAHFGQDQGAMPLTAAVSRIPSDTRDGGCDRPGRYLLSLHRTTAARSDRARWPVQVTFGTEAPLPAGTVPAPARTDYGAAPAPVTTPPHPVTGGAGFDDAARVATGVWRDRLTTAGTRYYTVHVGWGQQLSYSAEFAGAPGPASVRSTFVTTAAYAPGRLPVGDASGARGERAYDGSPVSVGLGTVPVTWTNRWVDGDPARAVHRAGDYWIAVGLGPGLPRGTAVPVLLRVQVTGTELAGPQYHAPPLGAPGGRSAPPSGPAPGPPGGPGWQPRGRPLSGGAGTADAPLMTAATTYRDTIAAGRSRFYGVTLDGQASAYLSAFALPPAGTRVAYGDGIELTLRSTDGSVCDIAEAHFQDDDARPVGTAVSRTIGAGSSCQDARPYTLEVHRTSAGTSDPGPWPLELRYVAEPALKSGASPPTAVPTAAPTATAVASPTPRTQGPVRPARGGTAIETAAAVKAGIWRDRLLPGQTRFYKVPVDWGQQATVFADASAGGAPQTGTAYVSSGVRMAVYSPVRDYVDGVGRGYDGTSASIGVQLAPVAYANRAAADQRVARVRHAGWYYVEVTVHPRLSQALPGPVQLTLRIDVTGAALPGPDYAGNARAAGIGLSAADISSADGTAAGSSPGRPGLRLLGFAALATGTALLLGLAAWSAAARLSGGSTRSATRH